MTLPEPPDGAPLYRRVMVGRIARGPSGLPVCLQCGLREADGRGRAFCSDTCRAAHRRGLRPPKARFQPCPGCGLACLRCVRLPPCFDLWRWRGRVPVWKASGEPVHGGHP